MEATVGLAVSEGWEVLEASVASVWAPVFARERQAMEAVGAVEATGGVEVAVAVVLPLVSTHGM